jgi:hypothetical protein
VSPNPISLEVGDSFTLRTQFGTHLHIIIAESSPDDFASVMLVYLSSTKNVPYVDKTTFVAIGEHTFVTKRSWVRYQNILICLRTEIPNNIVQHYGKVSESVLRRIQSGINKSGYVYGDKRSLFNQWNFGRLLK